MSKTKIKPNQILWITFAVQAVVCLLLFIGTAYFQIRESQLMDKQPAMQASEERAKAHIQNEQDIEQLRAAALHIQSASDITWDGVIKMMGDLDIALWGLFLGSLGLAIIGGYTVYVFRIGKPHSNSALD